MTHRFEKMRGGLMAQILFEHRKFTEVANMRNHKKRALKRLE